MNCNPLVLFMVLAIALLCVASVAGRPSAPLSSYNQAYEPEMAFAPLNPRLQRMDFMDSFKTIMPMGRSMGMSAGNAKEDAAGKSSKMFKKGGRAVTGTVSKLTAASANALGGITSGILGGMLPTRPVAGIVNSSAASAVAAANKMDQEMQDATTTTEKPAGTTAASGGGFFDSLLVNSETTTAPP